MFDARAYEWAWLVLAPALPVGLIEMDCGPNTLTGACAWAPKGAAAMAATASTAHRHRPENVLITTRPGDGHGLAFVFQAVLPAMRLASLSYR